VPYCPTCASTQARVAEQLVTAVREAEGLRNPEERAGKIAVLRQRQRELLSVQPYGVRERFYEYCAKWRAIGPQDGLLAQEFFNLLDELPDEELRRKLTVKWAGRYFLLGSALEKAAFLKVKKGRYQFHDARVMRAQLGKTCDPMIAGLTLVDLGDPTGRARHLSRKARDAIAKEPQERKVGKRRPRRRKPKPEAKPEVVLATPPSLPEVAGDNGDNGGNGGEDDAAEVLMHAPFAVLAVSGDESSSPTAPDGTPAN